MRVFVTSAAIPGNIGADPTAAWTTADQDCATIAASRSLGGAWVAWLTNSARPSMGPVLMNGGPWSLVQPDGSPDLTKIVAGDYADLVDGTLLRGINVDETGAAIGTNFRVWTGTNAAGDTAGTENCVDFTSTSMTKAAQGRPDMVDAQWTFYGYLVCSEAARLYCFERPR